MNSPMTSPGGMSDPCQTDRPTRTIEHLVHRSEGLAQEADNCARRLQDVLGRIIQGNSPSVLGSSNKEQPREALPELEQVGRNLDDLSQAIDSIRDSVNAFEAL